MGMGNKWLIFYCLIYALGNTVPSVTEENLSDTTTATGVTTTGAVGKAEVTTKENHGTTTGHRLSNNSLAEMSPGSATPNTEEKAYTSTTRIGHMTVSANDEREHSTTKTTGISVITEKYTTTKETETDTGSGEYSTSKSTITSLSSVEYSTTKTKETGLSVGQYSTSKTTEKGLSVGDYTTTKTTKAGLGAGEHSTTKTTEAGLGVGEFTTTKTKESDMSTSEYSTTKTAEYDMSTVEYSPIKTTESDMITGEYSTTELTEYDMSTVENSTSETGLGIEEYTTTTTESDARFGEHQTTNTIESDMSTTISSVITETPFDYLSYFAWFHDYFYEETDESFYDGLPPDTSYIQGVITDAMKSPEVVSYIANLTDNTLRYMVTENLRKCPLSALCYVSLPPISVNYDFDMTCCKPCSCDPECVRNGDCCPDVPWLFQTETDNRTLPRGVIKTCLPRGIPEQGYPLNNRVERIKALIGCPEDTDAELSSKCSHDYFWNVDTLSLYDVTFASNDVSGAIYRNVYCALCNGESVKNLTLWQPELSCGFMSEYSFFSTQEVLPKVLYGMAGCDVVFAVPETLDPSIESCSTYVSRCNVSGMWDEYNATIEEACELYGSFIEIEPEGLSDGPMFRNPFCAICNGYTSERLGCLFSQNYNEKYTFSGLLRLRESSLAQDDTTTDCPQGTQFDTLKGNCREVYCAARRELVGQKCLTITHMLQDILYIITLRVQPLKTMLISSAFEMASALGNALYYKLTSTDVPEGSCGPDVLLYVSGRKDNLKNGTLELNSTYFKFYYIRFQLNYKYIHNSTHLVEHFLGINNLQIGLENQSVVFLDSTEIENKNVSFKVNILNTNNTLFENARGVLNEIQAGSIYETNRYIVGDEENDFCVVPVLYTGLCWDSDEYDVLDLRPCPMFNISLDEYHFVHSLDGLYLPDNHKMLALSEFSFHEDRNSSYVSVCIDLYNERFLPIRDKMLRKIGLAEMVVSIVFVVISIICLVFSLLTYCLFKQLQTLPGKNNMALIVWLLIAQIIYLIGSFGGLHRGTIPCKVTGIVTHFCWLAALFWMQVCTFHMFRVLSKMRAMNSASGNGKYLLYHIYTVGMSMVFVTINVAVSMVTSNRTEMGYGTGPCYISSQTMIVLTFGLPTAFIVLGNITLFCVIVIKLKRAPNVDKNVQHERNYIFVFAKLSTITGAAWGFGLTYMWTGFEVLSYLFTILNASQGFFVMLGFVCNRRTLQLYKDISAIFQSSINGGSNRTNALAAGQGHI